MWNSARLVKNVANEAFQRAANCSFEVLFQGASSVVRHVVMSTRFAMQMVKAQTKAKTFQMLAVDVIYDATSKQALLLEVNLNGYLGLGLLAVPGGRKHFTDMLRLVGAAGYSRQAYQSSFEKRILVGDTRDGNRNEEVSSPLTWTQVDSLQDEVDEAHVAKDSLWHRIV